METCTIHSIHIQKRVCLYFQSVKPWLREVRVCSIKTLRSHGIQESAHLVFSIWSLLNLITDWFSDTFVTSANALAILAFLNETVATPLLTLAIYFRFSLAVQFVRAWLHQQVHKPFHYVHLPSRHQNPNNQTPEEHCSHSNYYLPYLLCLIFTRVTADDSPSCI